MAASHSLALVLLLIVAAMVFIRRVHSQVDGEFARLARAVEDPGFRAEERERLNGRLAGRLPLPDDFRPAAGPLPRWRLGLPPVFLLLAAVCLSHRAFGVPDPAGPADGPLAGFFVLAALGTALAVRRRLGRERLARLLRNRADLRRLDGDSPGAAEDLSESLRLAPWDDSSWAELADDLAASGRLEKALDAILRASGLDPHYADYRLVETSLCLRLGRLDRAGEALAGWRSLAGRRRRPAAGDASGGEVRNDPRLAVYQAALELASGGRTRAASALEEVDWENPSLPGMAADPALTEILKLFPAMER